MSRYVEHTETFTHKSGKKYRVEWIADDDMGSPLDWSDCHGVTERMDWNPTNDEQLEQHIADNEPELEEETRLRMMRVLSRPMSCYDSGLYYDFMASCELARTEWGVEPEKVVEIVEKDYAYLKGWYDDDWHWVILEVTALDEDDEPDETLSASVGGFESTIVHPRNDDDRQYHDDAINDLIAEVEHMRRKTLHAGQLELDFA